MKRLVAAVVGGVGIGALIRRRRSAPPAAPESSLADELRAKLAESRAAEPDAVVEPTPLETDLEARRREVHERAKKSIEELG